MFGIIHNPIPKVSLIYKCQDCGHKLKLLFVFISKKCPVCGGKNVKVAVGFIDKPSWPIVY